MVFSASGGCQLSSKRVLDRILTPDGLALLPDPSYEAALRQAVPVIADEAARYYYEESEEENWDQVEQIRNVAPPYDLMWIEYRAPKFIRSNVYGVTPWNPRQYVQSGTLFTYSEPDAFPPQFIQDFSPDARWIAQADIFRVYPPGCGPLSVLGDPGIDTELPILEWSLFYAVGQDGKLLEQTGPPAPPIPGQPELPQFAGKQGVFRSVPPKLIRDMFGFDNESLWRDQEARDNFLMMAGNHIPDLNVGLLALYLMHSRGAQLKTQHVPEAVRRKRERRGKAAGVVYKVLDIGLPMRQPLKEAKREGQGLEHALRTHLRRGNFAVYTPEKPHVSGYVGSMWRRPTVVGAGPGRVEKVYRSKTPAEILEEAARRRQERRQRS